ncbi:MAG: Dabb family protein [Alphaproteobacteria bacterium]|nr:Dabb family protein [Alphaproteobacteria bacterium]
MIKQVVVFSFADATPPERRRQVLDGLNRFPAWFPQIKSWSLGRNVSRRDDRYQYGFVAEFESMDALNEYLAHPQHESFVSEQFRPAIAHRSIVTLSGDV